MAVTFASRLVATDLPHTDGSNCTNCHLVHKALGGPYLNVVAGNANLCQSCHVPGGAASAKTLLNADQAYPATGLPSGFTATGNSHRWDSGVAGHVYFLGGSAVASTGTLTSTGTFNGPYSKTFTITVKSSGGVGTATFDWVATVPGGGSGSGVATGASVALDQGIRAVFCDGPGTSFQTGDRWQIFVRAGLQAPSSTAMQKTLVNGQMVCSSCHNQHSQQAAPFDPSAPPYVSGSGAGRHFMIADNSADQLCLDCHASRNVSSSLGGSHPVGVPIPATGDYKNPSLMPLSGSSNVLCDTCHDVHFAAETDGSLLRTTDRRAACTDCHTLADTTTPAAHMNALTSALWPGGQYGTTFPAITDTTLRGGCENCHNAHGWPVAGNPSSNYDKMLVDTEENLCLTCHDSDGPAAKDVKTDFAKTLHHPVSDTDPLRSPGRSVECNDCHNAHKAQNGTRNYSATATSTRNNVSNAPTLLGASGVAVDYSTLGNFVAPVR